MTQRTFAPATFIQPDTLAKVAALPILPWEVMTAREFLETLGVQDRMLANRWLYRSALGTPPFEPPNRWAVGPGAPRVIRKDRALAWAETAGCALSGRDCWPYAAKALAALGWPGLESPDAVLGILSFLLRHGVIQLSTPLKDQRDQDRFYAQVSVPSDKS